MSVLREIISERANQQKEIEKVNYWGVIKTFLYFLVLFGIYHYYSQIISAFKVAKVYVFNSSIFS